MAPARPRGPDIERTDEYEAFIEKLDDYHEKRGCAKIPFRGCELHEV